MALAFALWYWNSLLRAYHCLHPVHVIPSSLGPSAAANSTNPGVTQSTKRLPFLALGSATRWNRKTSAPSAGINAATMPLRVRSGLVPLADVMSIVPARCFRARNFSATNRVRKENIHEVLRMWCRDQNVRWCRADLRVVRGKELLRRAEAAGTVCSRICPLRAE